mgnify:FL=1
MKKTYITPQTNAIALNTEDNILNGVSNMGVAGNDDTIGGNDFLSNKKENPVWGGTHKGPWGE